MASNADFLQRLPDIIPVVEYDLEVEARLGGRCFCIFNRAGPLEDLLRIGLLTVHSITWEGRFVR